MWRSGSFFSRLIESNDSRRRAWPYSGSWEDWTMLETQKLRVLAEWCRDWAEMGNNDDRARSLSLADFFDKRADDVDARRVHAVLPRRAAIRHNAVELFVRH
jgi:hypothetical protein